MSHYPPNHQGAPPPPPPNRPPPPNVSLPPNVQALFDDNNRRYYYYNSDTGQVTWEPPVPAHSRPGPPPGPPPPQAAVAQPLHRQQQPHPSDIRDYGPTHGQQHGGYYNNQNNYNNNPGTGYNDDAYNYNYQQQPQQPQQPQQQHQQYPYAPHDQHQHQQQQQQPYIYQQQSYSAQQQPHPSQPPPPLSHQHAHAPPQLPPQSPTAPTQAALTSGPSLMPTPSLFDVHSGMSAFNSAYATSVENASFIQLELSAFELRKRDVIGNSDPICLVQVPSSPTLQVSSHTKWKTFGKTEVIRNTNKPKWTKRIRLPFLFEQNQALQFNLIDVDNFKRETGDFLGKCQANLADVVRNGSVTISLLGSRGQTGRYGKLVIRSHDENAAGRVRLTLNLAAEHLSNVERFGKSDPFFTLSCILPGRGAASTLCTSEFVKNDLNPRWKPQNVIIPAQGVRWDQIQLKFEVLDYNNTKAHQLIGETTVTLDQVVRSSKLELTNLRKRRSGKSVGRLLLYEPKAMEIPSFISYIQGGCRMKFVVAVDFTASNKPPTQPQSLHFISDPHNPSVYEQALKSVGSVILGYIPDGYITALGFGAKLPGGQRAEFDFALSGLGDPRVHGIDGLCSAYRTAVNSVRLSGPTYFTPLIRNVMARCNEDPVSQHMQSFTVLLILTDGMITDFDDTIDAIIDASYGSPLAIVIVGVGDADFSAMQYLDADEKRLQSRKSSNVAKHDIVQFVRYERTKSPEAFAAEVLQEIPQRLVDYMMDANIKPNPPQYAQQHHHVPM